MEENQVISIKEKIRNRYKGIDQNSIDIIPAVSKESFYDENKIKRVAVYARVSTGDPKQTSSYELQKNHYEDVVNKRPDWELVNIYADEGISGTSLKNRNNFIKMIEDCRAGKIDLIVTKSVSRFARNVVDCIGYVRSLAAMNPPIGVFFETENIYTLNSNAEMGLSFISTLAQEESHTKSEIMNSSIEMRFKRGIFLTPVLLGYDHDEDGNLIVNQEEAKIVRIIFYLYYLGKSSTEIAELLIKIKAKTKKKHVIWSSSTILSILQNERYCGDILARKTWTPNYIDHKSKKNRKDRNQYFQKEHHEAIIPRDLFISIQHLIANRKYGITSFLPGLNVIHSGDLKGFVLIHTKWASFKLNHYQEASLSVYNDIAEIQASPLEIFIKSGELNLTDYEVAKSEFFDIIKKPYILFTKKYIRFSLETIRLLDHCSNIEIYMHPGKYQLLIRQSEDAKRSVCWYNKNKIVSKSIYGSAFIPTIYNLCNWDINNQYRISGSFYQINNEKFILFDFHDTEILIKNDNEEYFKKKNKICAYPIAWKFEFGNQYYEGKAKFEMIRNINFDLSNYCYKDSLIHYDKSKLENDVKQIIQELEMENNNEQS